jgi:hypothetical protein
VLFAVLLVPRMFVLGAQPSGIWWWFNPITIILLGATTMAFYVTGQYFHRRRWIEGLVWLVAAPLVMAFGAAMSVTCCLAAVEGLLTSGGEFVRTPKSGGHAAEISGLLARLRSRVLFTAVLCGEVALGACVLAGAAYFEREGMPLITLVLLIKGVGFLGVAAMSTHDLLPRVGGARP